MKPIICNICGQKSTLIEEYHQAPHMLMNVYDSDRLLLHDLEIYHCDLCGHTWIPDYVSGEYYNEYSMGSFWGASFRRIRELQIERLATLAPARMRFLDIGCGVGHYLELAKKHFEEVYGVEPSLSNVMVARENGFSVIHDYFHEELQFETGYDVISFIEVLEHIEQPAVLVSLAANLLNENGILFVEVPNGQRIYKNSLYNNLSTDHIQYFSVTSLAAMAQKVGLEVLCTQESLDPNLIELYARKTSTSFDSFEDKRKYELERFCSQLKAKARIAAWGAGAEAVCFIAMIEGKFKIDCLFDSDLSKHGHKIASIPIIKPTTSNVKQFDTIVILANAHKVQIQNQLKELGYTGSFITFNES